MSNIVQISVTEKELYAELEYLMVIHRHNCSAVEIINTSNAVYLYRLKKALLKSTVEEKRIAVLKSIITSVNEKINRGLLFKEIFEPLPAIAADRLRNYRKSKSSENKKTDKSKEKYIDENYEKQKRIDYLNFIVDEICNKFKDLTKPELEELEIRLNKKIRDNTSYYGIDKANIEILGNLYTGMIESTRKNFEKLLREEYGILLNSNDRLSDKMSRELLLYRVAALYYTNVMTSKRIEKIKPDLDSDYINKEAYRFLNHDVYMLGKVTRIKYLNDYGITPKEELIENYAGSQLSINSVIKNRKK